ncbi:MAG TPA: mechanosensitive ion channel domain-containing protein [Stellaceae bacterium]
MRRHVYAMGGGPWWSGPRLLTLALLVWAALSGSLALAHDTADAALPSGEMNMNSAGWLERIIVQLENEAVSDFSMLPDTPAALEREWRSFDRNGSALGALINVGWVALAALIAFLAERCASRGLSRPLRQAIRARPEGPSLSQLLLLLLCDVAGVLAFAGIFVFSRHTLMNLGVTVALILLSANVLIRWRIATLVVQLVLRPSQPATRLIDIPDDEARRLGRFLSGTILLVLILVAFERHGLMDVDSGASHVIGLILAGMVFAVYALIVLRARVAAEALVRGHSSGLIGALRAQLARAWLPIGLFTVAGLMVFFVFGLSLDLLSYYHGFVSTLGVLTVVLVLEKLSERGWHTIDSASVAGSGRDDRLVARSLHRILRGVVLVVAALTLAWIWSDAAELTPAQSGRVMSSTGIALATLFIAFLGWELARLVIDRHLQDVATGPKLPGADAEEEESVTGSRLQTILPMLRAVLAAVIAVVALLVVLSDLGIDTAPLIAGAGVFGLAISFGSQSLVRDIISGLFYMWDDAFRIGEYIDTGRLRGLVEAIGVRSIKLRHHNGPLHTIPYGQLGAVTNLSRDFATMKFNLRLEIGTDIELVRRTAKQIGLGLQEENPEIASEVILPLKMQGIAEIIDNAVVCRFKFTARPVKPTWVQREYLKRMYQVFCERGINFAMGGLTLRAVVPDELGAADVASLPLPAPSRVA